MYGSPEYKQKYGDESIKLKGEQKVAEPKLTYLPKGLRLKQELKKRIEKKK